ncbi:MAG: hypothetical protein HY815_08665 [Candidatus Riflebacteria bacterium]|nr:hypothetical protein [Candidatus Riflebacteria bacterium]
MSEERADAGPRRGETPRRRPIGKSPVDRDAVRRALIAGVCLVLIAASSYLAGGETLRMTLATCLADPAAHAGRKIVIYREARVVERTGADRILVWEKGLGDRARCVAVGIAGPAGPGETVSLEGRFQPPDRVVVDRYRVHAGRFRKVYLSVPVLLFVVGLLIRAFRPGPGGLVERVCRTC